MSNAMLYMAEQSVFCNMTKSGKSCLWKFGGKNYIYGNLFLIFNCYFLEISILREIHN